MPQTHIAAAATNKEMTTSSTTPGKTGRAGSIISFFGTNSRSPLSGANTGLYSGAGHAKGRFFFLSLLLWAGINAEIEQTLDWTHELQRALELLSLEPALELQSKEQACEYYFLEQTREFTHRNGLWDFTYWNRLWDLRN